MEETRQPKKLSQIRFYSIIGNMPKVEDFILVEKGTLRGRNQLNRMENLVNGLSHWSVTLICFPEKTSGPSALYVFLSDLLFFEAFGQNGHERLKNTEAAVYICANVDQGRALLEEFRVYSRLRRVELWSGGRLQGSL